MRSRRQTILDITRRHHGEHAAALVADWRHAALESLRVPRDHAGDVAAFLLLCDRTPSAPASSVCCSHAAAHRDAGETPGPAQAALWIDAKRVWQLRTFPRRMYLAVTAWRRRYRGPTDVNDHQRQAPPLVIEGDR